MAASRFQKGPMNDAPKGPKQEVKQEVKQDPKGPQKATYVSFFKALDALLKPDDTNTKWNDADKLEAQTLAAELYGEFGTNADSIPVTLLRLQASADKHPSGTRD